MKDAQRKGRMAKSMLIGISVGQVKLTKEQVGCIRKMIKFGIRQNKLAALYRVSDSLISQIVHGTRRKGALSPAQKSARAVPALSG
jgi:hypothetical protein